MSVVRSLVVVALAATFAACTTTTTEPPPPPPSEAPTGSLPAVGARLADGEPLPDGCTSRRTTPRQTVAFGAGGRVWALDPGSGRLSCLFEARDPAPFLWGPQGDRVLVDGFRVAGLDDVPSLTLGGVTPSTADWGHPVGIAIVFAEQDRLRPEKFFLESDDVEVLRDLPSGRYLDVAYHPSGLALAFVVETTEGQSIWISTNEGKDPHRLVFSKAGTRFTSIAFSTDGRELIWTALHANGYVQLHSMRLADRTGFTNGWRGEGLVAGDLVVAPGEERFAVTAGEPCADRQALALLGGTAARPAVPEETRPTEALGWLDATTLLVAAGGCDGEAVDLYAARPLDREADLLVTGVDAGASRAAAPRSPARVPAPTAEEAPPSGVG